MDNSEQQLLERERAVSKRERELKGSDQDFGPGTRLLMTVFAQGAGFFLLSILGVLIAWPTDLPDIVRGYNFIQRISWIYLLLTISLPAVMLVIAAVQREIKQG